jgi:hypothetical protein
MDFDSSGSSSAELERIQDKLSGYIEPEAALGAEVITPAIVATADRTVLIQHLALRIDRGESISAEVINKLLARYFEAEVTWTEFSDEFKEGELTDTELENT